MFASYSTVQQARSLASVVGEEELSDVDKLYMKFGEEFEKNFLTQDFTESRTIDETLNLGWELLRILPASELDRVDPKYIEKYYNR